jgi:hypothetical protein
MLISKDLYPEDSNSRVIPFIYARFKDSGVPPDLTEDDLIT